MGIMRKLRPGRGRGCLETRRVPPLDAAPSTLNPDRFGLKELVPLVHLSGYASARAKVLQIWGIGVPRNLNKAYPCPNGLPLLDRGAAGSPCIGRV